MLSFERGAATEQMMDVQLKPDMEQFVREQVAAGHFSSPAEVLEAGLARLMLDPAGEELDPQDVAEIRESLAQMHRGEVLDWKEHSAKLRKRYLGE